MDEELRPGCTKLEHPRPSCLETALRNRGQLLDAALLAKDRHNKALDAAQTKRNERLPDGTFAKGHRGITGKKNGASSGPSLREKIYTALYVYEEQTGRDVMAEALSKNPLAVLQLLAQLEPKNVKVDQTIKQVIVVCHPQRPPEGWQPPDLSQPNDPEVQQALDAHVIDEAMGDDEPAL